MKTNITIGMDLGDQNHVIVVMDENGREIEKKVILLSDFSHDIKGQPLPLKPVRTLPGSDAF